MREHVKKFQKALKAAGDTAFYVEGVIKLTVDFSGHRVSILLGVARVLATKIILETAFIDNFLRSIETKKRLIIPKIEKPVPINAAFQIGAMPTVDFVNEQQKNKTFPWYVAKMKTTPPHSQATIQMRTKAAGSYVLDLVKTNASNSTVLVAQGVIEVVPNKPFISIVSNLSDVLITVHKHTKLALMTEHPTIIVNMIDDNDELPEEDEPANAVPV